jgi:hypothetical protein
LAKQLVNPIERHVEKAVLGLAGALLLGIVAKYVVTKPNSIELGGERMYPDTIDRQLALKAEVARQSLRSHQPKGQDFTPVVEEFIRDLNPLKKLSRDSIPPSAVPIGPEVPIIDPFSLTSEKARLVEVLKPSKPRTTSGRMLISTSSDPVKKGSEVEVDWVTVSALFDRKAQAELQQRAYGLRYADVLFAPAQLQRRQRRPDGSWSDEDWKDVEGWPSASLPKTPPVPLVTEGKNTFLAKDDALVIDKFNELLSRPSVQLECLRPMPPNEATSPRTWRFPVLTTVQDVATQDDEYLYASSAEPPAGGARLLRFPWLEGQTETPKERGRELTPAELIRKDFERADKLLESAKKTRSSSDAADARNLYVAIMDNAQATPSDKTRAERRYQEVEQLLKEIKHLQPGTEEGSGTKGTQARELGPIQQTWVHDAEPQSLINGETYQYRMRMVLVNRLLGVPEKLDRPSDAARPFLEGPWSEPSDPVTLEPATQFFITRFDERKKEVTAEMFQWFRGVWVETKHRLKIGDRVALEDRVDTPDPDDPAQKFRRPVLFDAGATVVDIDFDRRIRERKIEKGGVRFLPPGDKTCAVVLIGGNGQLVERLEALDRSDPAKSQIKSRVWKAPKETE